MCSMLLGGVSACDVVMQSRCLSDVCNAAQLLEWWYTSAEEKLAAEQKLEPPPPPPPPLPSPQGVPLPSDPSVCPLCRQVRTTAKAGAVHALTNSALQAPSDALQVHTSFDQFTWAQ